MEVKRIKLDIFPFEKLPLELQLMIFSYCTPKERRDNLSFVSKSWAENLQSFTEDYQLDLYDCYLKEEIDPFSVLIKSTRQYRFLKLGKHVSSENSELVSRLLSHLGKHVHVLKVASTEEILSLLKDSNPLLMFPELKKLIVKKISDLKKFDIFPESLEHIHIKELSVLEQTKEVDHLKKVKNLRFWTSKLINFKVGKDASGELSTTIFCLDEKLKEILESMQTLDNIYLTISTNLLEKAGVQIDDVIGVRFQGKPKVFPNINKLPNLRSIILSWRVFAKSELPCVGYHKLKICSKVKELKINWNNKSCIRCFTTFIVSFPNLKKLVLLHCEFKNEQFKYICSKLPHLKHLEVESSNINGKILFIEPPEYSLGNLKNLHTLNLSRTIVEQIEKWPFMPNLRDLNIEFASHIPEKNLRVFCDKVPNIEFFETGEKPNEDDASFIEILTQRWKNLRTFMLSYNRLNEREYANIQVNCKKLRKLEIVCRAFTPALQHHFFNVMPCLRKIGDHFYRKDSYNMVDYLKRNRIYYNEIGALKRTVEEYTIESSDENYAEIDEANEEFNEKYLW
uniref:CSON005917 protein n=1 Tax=Culicoides sonorensis TaxID=179676 RepID=A0A336MSK6_CULSO